MHTYITQQTSPKLLKTRHIRITPHVSITLTTDIDYPLVKDLYLQGKMYCANVLSDSNAMTVTVGDAIQIILAVSKDERLERHRA